MNKEMQRLINQKIDEYELKLLQEFAFSIYGGEGVTKAEQLREETDTKKLKRKLSEMKNTMDLKQFYYLFGGVSYGVLSEAKQCNPEVFNACVDANVRVMKWLAIKVDVDN